MWTGLSSGRSVTAGSVTRAPAELSLPPLPLPGGGQCWWLVLTQAPACGRLPVSLCVSVCVVAGASPVS